MATDAAAATELGQTAVDNAVKAAEDSAGDAIPAAAEPPLREDQVANAVAFLSNPKVCRNQASSETSAQADGMAFTRSPGHLPFADHGGSFTWREAGLVFVHFDVRKMALAKTMHFLSGRTAQAPNGRQGQLQGSQLCSRRQYTSCGRHTRASTRCATRSVDAADVEGVVRSFVCFSGHAPRSFNMIWVFTCTK